MMAAIWPRSNIKLISFSIERTQIHDFMAILGVLGTPDTAVKPESTLDMASTKLKQINDFDVCPRVFS